MRSRSTLKSRQVAVVDADHVGVDLERALELALVVDLDEHVEVERQRLARAAGASSLAASAATISRIASAPGRRRLVDLVGVDDEVLAQDRQRATPRAPRAGRRASRRSAALGQDRQRRGAAALVGADDLGRPSRPRGSRRPTASGACARRSREIPGRASASENGRSSPRPASSRSSSASGTVARGAARRPRRGRTRRSLEHAHPRASTAAMVRSRRSARAPRRGAGVDRRLGGAHARLERLGAAGDVDRRAGVEHGEVARRTAARRRGSRACVRRSRPASRRRGRRARSRAGRRRRPRRQRSMLGRSARRRDLDDLRACRRCSVSSRPSSLDTTSALLDAQLAPAPRRSCPDSAGSETPISCRVAPAGFVSGPRKLKIVRTASSLRTGTTKRVAW